MLFSSTIFPYWFLPLVLLLYFLTPKKGKNYVLLLASLFFYFSGDPKYTLLLIASAILNYLLALLIVGLPKQKKLFLLLTVIVNIGALIFFKFSDLWVELANGWWGTELKALPLPLGISFYTFQAMSYMYGAR